MIKNYEKKTSKEEKTIAHYGVGNNTKTSKDVMIKYYEDKSIKQSPLVTKEELNKAVRDNNLKEIRRISSSLESISPIYSRLNELFGNALCYYWIVNPKLTKNSMKSNLNNLEDELFKVCDYVEKINPEKLGRTISKKVMRDGACYIAVKEKVTKKNISIGIQFLPLEYCKVVSSYKGRDVVSFNCKFFDDKFRNAEDKEEALSLFPPCVVEKYYEWTLSPNKTKNVWKTLDPDFAFRFAIREDEYPFFISSANDILNLADVKEINMYKLEQELSKIIVQKFPVDKENRSSLEKWEIESYHNDLCKMIDGVPGLDAVTTFAEIDSIDIGDSRRETASSDSVGRAYKSIFDGAGISQSLFNSDSSGSLGKSVIADESILISSILQQMQEFLNVRIATNFRKGEFKNILFSLSMLPVTFSNRADMIKLYKELASLGYSKFLPAIAAGQRQTDILSSMRFEEEVISMASLMIPPKSSNTISNSDTSIKEQKNVGRPEKDAEERSEKTEQNRETL